MTVEQVARDFIANMTDEKRTMASITPDAMVSGGVLPAPIPATEAFGIVKALQAAFPDYKIDIQNVQINGNMATVSVMWGGTQSGALNLPGGMPSVPPTGKKAWVKDTYKVTVRGDKVSHMEVVSPADGGIPAALAQLGVKMPAM